MRHEQLHVQSRVGSEAAKLFLQTIKHPGQKPQRVKIPCQLVRRKSYRSLGP